MDTQGPILAILSKPSTNSAMILKMLQLLELAIAGQSLFAKAFAIRFFSWSFNFSMSIYPTLRYAFLYDDFAHALQRFDYLYLVYLHHNQPPPIYFSLFPYLPNNSPRQLLGFE